MNITILTLILLVISNVFMIFAWYGHLKMQEAGVTDGWPVFLIILFSWGIALIEYCFMIPANRIGYSGNGGPFNLMQLKVIQEVITLVIFVIFSVIMFNDFHFKWNHALAACCLVTAVYLVFMD